MKEGLSEEELMEVLAEIRLGGPPCPTGPDHRDADDEST